MSTSGGRVLPRDVHGIEPALLHGSLDRLEALSVVKDARCDEKFRHGRVICNLWCSGQHEGNP